MWQASQNKDSKAPSELEEYGKFLKNKNLINESNIDQRLKQFPKYKQYKQVLQGGDSPIDDVEPDEYEETIELM